MAEGLLPCPFCGAEAAYEEVEDRASSNPEAIRFSVGCGNEDCIGCQSMTSFSRRIDAIAAWNRRAGVETTPPRLYEHENYCNEHGGHLRDSPACYLARERKTDDDGCSACGHATRYHFDDGAGNVVCRASSDCECCHRAESIPAVETKEHLHWCAIRIGKGCNCHSEAIERRLAEKATGEQT